MDENGRNRLYAGPEPGVCAQFCPKEDERADDNESAAEGNDADIRTARVPEERASSRPAGHRAASNGQRAGISENRRRTHEREMEV